MLRPYPSLREGVDPQDVADEPLVDLVFLLEPLVDDVESKHGVDSLVQFEGLPKRHI